MPDAKYSELWDELLDAEAAVESAGNPYHSFDAIQRLKQHVRPSGTAAGDVHNVAVLRDRIAAVVAALS